MQFNGVSSHKQHSFPKNKIRILLLENVAQVAVDALQKEGFQVEATAALTEEELVARLEGSNGYDAIHAIGVRSKTALTAELLAKSKRLLCIGCFCIGVDNHDLDAAQRHGIPIFNSPFSNTRSVAELVLGEIIAVSRQLLERSIECHRGAWLKVAKGCYEVRGKTLGIIGYGHVGSQVSVLAESLGMKVLYYDVVPKLSMGNAVQCQTIDQVLQQCKYVTIHVPQLESTRNLIGAEQIAMMTPGSFLINASRGDVVDVVAFADAVRSGHLAGGAADVFPFEPKKNGEGVFESPLCGLKNVMLTPHIGGSTEEAQEAIGVEVANALIKYINSGSTYGSVNFPEIDIPARKETHRLLNCHQNVPGVLMKVNTALTQVGVNIVAQQLATSDHVGYLVTDVDKAASDEALKVIKELPENIKTRVLW
eukprot:CAMPEP_0119321944 /NCGR_PEP_ID=MMETSP1333-20130426/56864_1 /TAXON_ID=418940 /ORGANISM="Scyphosphaera apsteinii, Strain RCC1455" /LENGTH=422 /DNA_ID=CAMNT_0007329049 /DNA_START=17 /DNA_END=1285 /DNA_ORIENTATION=+